MKHRTDADKQGSLFTQNGYSGQFKPGTSTRGDNPRSLAAYSDDSTIRKLRRREKMILHIYWTQGPMTDRQMKGWVCMLWPDVPDDMNSVRPRIKDLKDVGLVRVGSETQEGGLSVQVCQLTQRGNEYMNERHPIIGVGTKGVSA